MEGLTADSSGGFSSFHPFPSPSAASLCSALPAWMFPRTSLPQGRVLLELLMGKYLHLEGVLVNVIILY